jgi:hypothetical protein
MTTERKEGRFLWEKGSHLFRRMTRAMFAPLLGTRNSPTPPTPTPLSSWFYPVSVSSDVACSSKSISGMPARDTAQNDHEMRTRSQDCTSSQCRRDDRNDPPPSSGSDPHPQEMRSHLFRPRRSQLQKSRSTSTTFPQGQSSHASNRMTRTSSTVLPGHGPQPTGTQFESELASGTGKMPADRKERRPRFPSTLQSLLSNDFRCVVRCRAVSHDTDVPSFTGSEFS